MPLRNRIVLVDDHAAVRAGYRRYLECEHDMEVVGEASNADQAQTLLAQTPCDVLVLDISMPGQSGLDLIKRLLLKWPKLTVVVLSMHDSPVIAEKALGLGAKAYVTKSSDPDELVYALRQAVAGLSSVSKDIAVQQQTLDLTARETDIVRLLVGGHTIDQAAVLLGISSKTVSNNLSQIRQKLNVQTDFELAAWAWSQGLGPQPPKS